MIAESVLIRGRQGKLRLPHTMSKYGGADCPDTDQAPTQPCCRAFTAQSRKVNRAVAISSSGPAWQPCPEQRHVGGPFHHSGLVEPPS
jgi:hypothetical protein